MANPSFLPLIRYDFDTTANRLAATWTTNDIGVFAFDAERGQMFMVMAAGTGAASFSPLSRSSGTQKRVGIPLHLFKLMTSGSDVGNIAAIGGVGASDSDPVLRGDANGSQEWSWANGSHVGAIGTEFPLPDDFDGSQDVTLEIDVYSGTTDAATMAVATSWDGATEVTDSASDSATKSATRHSITATIDKADVPDSAKTLSLRLTPPTHATNAVQVCRVALKFTTK